MRRWAGAVMALVLAVGTAVGLGLVASNRQQPIITHWAAPGETQVAAGMEFELVGISVVDYEPEGISDPVPMGAVAVVAELRQRVVEVPEDSYGLSCEIRLENGADSWYPSFDVAYDLDLEPDCHRVDGEDVVAGQERTISVAWVVPESAVQGARVAMRFYAVERVGIGFSSEG